MREGLGRLSAVAYGFVGLWALWLLASVCFSSAQPFNENLKGILIVAGAIGIFYALHRLTRWVIGAAAEVVTARRE